MELTQSAREIPHNRDWNGIETALSQAVQKYYSI